MHLLVIRNKVSHSRMSVAGSLIDVIFLVTTLVGELDSCTIRYLYPILFA